MYDFAAINSYDPLEAGKEMQEFWFPSNPWPDYDEACETRVVGGSRGDPETIAGGFFPISPKQGPERLKLASIEAGLTETELQLALDPLMPRARFHAVINKHRFRSWIAQLRGEVNAIPEAAGCEYVEWIEWLRVHDPAFGGDPYYEITDEDRRRTRDAIKRNKTQCRLTSEAYSRRN